MCLVIVAGVSFVPFVALHYYPYPTTTSIQSVLQNDTIPLYFATKTDLPPSYDTYWYEYAVVRMSTDPGNEPDIPVEVFYIEGQSACSPLANNTAVQHVDSADIPISPEDPVTDVFVNKYLTSGSNMLINITTISDIESETETLNVYVINNKNDYDCFRKGGGVNCESLEHFTFPLQNGTFDTLNYTFPQSSYYFLILTSTAPATVQFSYELSYQFYNFADYAPTSSCSIDDQDQCKFFLNDTRGCLFAHSPLLSEDPSFADLSVTVVHKVFTLPSYLAVYFGGGITFLMLVAIAAIFFFMVKYCLYKYSY